jgi:hypothetical protein
LRHALGLIPVIFRKAWLKAARFEYPNVIDTLVSGIVVSSR